MSKTSIITNNPKNKVIGDTLSGGKISLLLFKSDTEFKSFLKSLGISGALINSGDIPVLSTYIKALGLGILSSSLKKYTTDFDNYLKRGQAAKFSFGPKDQLLVVYIADNWKFLAKKTIRPGVNYMVTTKRGSWGRHSASIVQS